MTEFESVFNNVNDWLKHAESKNAVLIGMNGAIVFGVINILLEYEISNSLINVYLISVGVFTLLSILVSIISFFPITTIPWLFGTSEVSDSDNLLFYGHIKNYTVRQYREKITKLFKIDTDLISDELINQYIGQIITNSIITYKKLSLFKVAMVILLCGVITPIGGFCIYFILEG